MSPYSFSHLKVEKHHGIARLRLSNPRQLNALHQALLEELSLAVDDLYADTSLSGAILMGEGDRAFAAGADIKEFSNLLPEAAAHLSKKGQKLFQRIEDCPIPIVAAVRGFALGGGCELAMACHLRVASPSALFGQPEVKLGLIPGYGGTQRLVQLIGKTRAMEWILSGEVHTAKEALEIGLINRLSSTEESLEASAEELLNKVTIGSPEAISASIACVNRAAAPQAYEEEVKAFAQCAGTENFKEGTSAFLEKRKASFSGRK